jgi:hypothetical protein
MCTMNCGNNCGLTIKDSTSAGREGFLIEKRLSNFEEPIRMNGISDQM